MIRLGVFASHPIQYFSPLWRRLAESPAVELQVHFFSDCGLGNRVDKEFGKKVNWDVPLTEGYNHCFIRRGDLVARQLRLNGAREMMRAGGFDWVMIHGYQYPFERQIIQQARLAGVAVLQRGEFSDERPRTKAWMHRIARDAYLRWFYSRVDRFCFLGMHGQRHLQRLGIPNERLFFSPYAVDSTLFENQYQSCDRLSARRSLGIEEEDFVVLFSGKFIPRKAPLLLLEAISRIQNRRRITVIMLGSGQLQSRIEGMKARIAPAKLFLPGFVNQSQLGVFFRSADTFVLPSRFETWGLVVNEAMQFGLPTIVGENVGCHPDLIKKGETGFVFDDGDPDKLAEYLIMLRDDHDRREHMGINARQHIRNYSTEAAAAGILRALDAA